MRIVITGASGNVGTALLRRLGEADSHELIGLARRIPERGRYAAGVEWVAADLTDAASVEVMGEVFTGADAVVHLAWGFQPSHNIGYLEKLGVTGTRRVIEAAATSGVPHLVHMSSVGAYSAKRNDRPVDESWPTDGIASSWYSRSKAKAERLLDAHERAHGTLVTRMRPGIIGQMSAGSSLLRYALPAALPAKALDLVPLLPLDRRLAIPMVHSDDVAEAIARAVERRVGGAFNLAADPPITVTHIADALGARSVHVPASVVRTVVAGLWRAHLQQVDPGWLDLGYAVPLLDTTRAQEALGWLPTVDAVTVLRELLEGMRTPTADRTPVLRPRTVAGQLRRALQQGPVSLRKKS